MILYRIASKIYARDLSGTGALLYGGRWNPKGKVMLYTSQSFALAALETIVNLSPSKIGQRQLYCVEIDFPDQLPITSIDALPEQWNAYPYTPETVLLGAGFIEENGLCLMAPNAIVPSEYNYLLNPNHPDYDQIRIKDVRPFILDNRFEQLVK
ncbi:MAG: RES family NAD+ phosphorylase [Cyclobacteriaceae bacterium]|nr:RES family NAD+ phosphorylase [Cyclobacteriaceae bacterium HetDA_MAG_MS6]